MNKTPSAPPVPTRSTAEWQQIDRAHYLHPFTDHAALHRKGTRVITRAEGVYLYDSDGRQLLDGMAGLWCVNLGYGRRELATAAYEQLLQLPYYNSFFQTAHPPALELSRLLGEVTAPQFNRVFFTGSGSEANDTVVRLVRYFWQVSGKPERSVIISRHNAYHGSTMAGASLGGMKPMHGQGGMPIPGIVHIRQPYWYGEGGDLTPDEFGLVAARALEEKILELGPDKVAAFIAEPVQGAGGVVIPPRSYWPEIQRIVDKYGILLVVDEVICGFGRTGAWFGSDYYGVRPDLMPIAKGMSSGYMPIGGLMVGDRVAAALLDEDREFHHGFTYSGHPAACAVACAAIHILRNEKVVEHVRDVAAPYLAQRWAGLADHPLVGETRTLGLLGAIELVRGKSKRQFFQDPGKVGTLCRDICFDNGLVMRAVRDTMIVSPPLVITRAQIDELADKARRCLDLTWAAVQKGGY
jgi:putrescine aminotransferase